MSRKDAKKKIFEANQLGKRIKWSREKIKVGFKDIERELGIPESNIRSIENGGRTTIYEDLELLANFFTKRIEKIYKHNKPQYEGVTMDVITPTWLVFGVDPYRDEYKRTIDLIEEDFRARELELIERNFALDRLLTELRQGKRDVEREDSEKPGSL